MNPLANIEFRQTQRDAIGEALEGRSRREVDGFLEGKANSSLNFDGGPGINYTHIATITGILGFVFVGLGVGLGIGVHVAFVGGFGAASALFVTGCIFSCIQAKKQANQPLNATQISNRLDNAMIRLRQAREDAYPGVASQDRSDQNAEQAVNQYFSLQINQIN